MENSKENKKLKNKSHHKVKLLSIYPKELKTHPKGTWIYCSIIYHTQDMETTCVHQKIKKEDVVYIDTMEFY